MQTVDVLSIAAEHVMLIRTLFGLMERLAQYAETPSVHWRCGQNMTMLVNKWKKRRIGNGYICK
jgi:hypothetical protein